MIDGKQTAAALRDRVLEDLDKYTVNEKTWDGQLVQRLAQAARDLNEIVVTNEALDNVQANMNQLRELAK